MRERIAARWRPRPSDAQGGHGTWRNVVYGAPLNLLTITTFPGHEPDRMDEVRLQLAAWRAADSLRD